MVSTQGYTLYPIKSLKMKQIVDSLKVFLIGSLGVLLLLGIYSTVRIRWRSLGASQKRDVFEKPAKIVVLWHGRQFIIPMVFWRFRSNLKNKFHALISLHSDGRLIAFVVRFFGIHNVSGSSTRGGKEATLALIEKLKAGDSIALTPDGPKGPIYKSKPGVLKMSYATGAPILPVSFAATKYWQFKSWDKMMLPKPFSRVEIVVGRPYLVTEELSDDNINRLLEEVDTRLNEARQEADAACA